MTRATQTLRPFTDAEDAAILDGIRAGHSHSLIAQAIGRPKSSIWSRLQTIYGHRKRTPEDVPDDDDLHPGPRVTVATPAPGVRIVTHRLVG